MEKQKKLGLLGILMFCVLAGICFAHPIKAEAAAFKTIVFANEKREKVGGYYLWRASDGSALYVSKSKTGKGKIIAKSSKGVFNEEVLSNGSLVYYTYYSNNSHDDNGQIYSVKIDGKNRKYIGKVKYAYRIQAYYNGNLYIWDADWPNNSIYRLNIKTGKVKCIQKSAMLCDQYKHYLLIRNINKFDGKYSNAYIYNCKTRKSIKISNKVFSGLNFVSGKVYYAEKVNNKSISIKSCSLTGKSKKTLVRKLSANLHNTGKITSRYVYYMNPEASKCYRYDMKTKKSKKISQKAYEGDGL